MPKPRTKPHWTQEIDDDKPRQKLGLFEDADDDDGDIGGDEVGDDGGDDCLNYTPHVIYLMCFRARCA